MRIALVTDGLFPLSVGGMQAHSTNLARSLAQAGVDVELFYPAIEGMAPADVISKTRLPADRVRVAPVAWPSALRFPGHYVSELWRYSERVRKLLVNRTDIDWIYVQGLCGLALLTGNRSQLAPVAVNLHGLEMFQISPSLGGSVQQILLRPPARFSALRADLAVSLGAGTSRILASLGVPPSRIVEIPVGIDGGWVVDLPRQVRKLRRFVFVGRYERRKGIAELGAAIRALKPTHDFEFDFVGPIPPVFQIASPGVRYLGAISDRGRLREILDECDVIVCPSYAEGMPTVILEGMARGLAVIATSVGAVDELVGPKNGWLIEPASPSALRKALLDSLAISNEELFLKKLASLSRLGGKFRWDQIGIATAQTLERRLRAN